MRKTSGRIEFGLIDVSAKEDSSLSVTQQQPFSHIEELEGERLKFKKYATLETDWWALDGTMELFPDVTGNVSLGWWSSAMSDSKGVFQSQPVLEVTFRQMHSSIGLTLYFYYTEWASKVNVKWYQGATLLADKTDSPDSNVYAVSQPVENYNRIVVTFLGTNHPDRYLKLTGIDYGVTKIFGGKELMSAKTEQEINPISEEITINTIDFQVHSSSAEFSIINPQGIYKFLQQRQPLTVYQTIDGTDQLNGIYYLETWDGKNENTFSMSAVDTIGVMDGTQFDGGMYSNITFFELASAILNDAGFHFFSIDESLKNRLVSGWIPISSHRDALQQAAFAVSAVVDTSQSDLVRIYPAHYTATQTIQRPRKMRDGSVSLRPFVTGVQVTEHNYTQSAAAADNLFEGLLPPGPNKVTFADPCYGLSVSSAALITAHVNYAIVNVAAEQKVTITGKKYVDSTRPIGKHMPNLPGGEKQKILIVKDATLVSASNSTQVAQAVFDYHQNRIEQTFSYQVENEKPGESYRVQTLYDQTKTGLMESLETDLTGGCIGKAVLSGG